MSKVNSKSFQDNKKKIKQIKQNNIGESGQKNKYRKKSINAVLEREKDY